ncbi:TadE/TadG family type IV pilus assembly protein [Sphingomonas sp. MMS24-J13]|uniref:TadE/TadG family type IV pilus assembly protein n=1 Tax=Sphingomonas sp. MMS24-J13 TaxID=3238686 RepID=UPI00384C6D83
MRRLKQLRSEQGGVAAVEFALASLFMFVVIMVGLDFGLYAQQKLRLGGAVAQAAILAYNTQVGTSTSVISSYVQTAAKTIKTPTVTITCNGTTTCGDGKCSCLTSTGGFTIAASCNAACSSGAISGNYLKIVAAAVYPSMIVPDKYLGGSTITQSAVVRLQ